MATILIVDDDASVVKGMLRLLLALGHEGTGAATGAAALVILADRAFDLIIVDDIMPGMHGIEFIRRVRSDPKIAHAPLVLYTGTPDDQHRGLAVGADDCWMKGEMDFDTIGRRIDRLTAGKG